MSSETNLESEPAGPLRFSLRGLFAGVFVCSLTAAMLRFAFQYPIVMLLLSAVICLAGDFLAMLAQRATPTSSPTQQWFAAQCRFAGRVGYQISTIWAILGILATAVWCATNGGVR